MSDRISSKEAFEDSSRVEQSKLKKYQEENHRLKTILKESKLKFETGNIEKESELMRQASEIIKLKNENHELFNKSKIQELEKKELCQKILVFQLALKNQIKSKTQSKEELMQEIDQVEDAYALVVINKLLFGNDKKQDCENDNKKKVESERIQNLLDLENKKTIMKLSSIKTNNEQEIQTLKSQNDFLLTQLEFAEKQLVAVGVKPDYNHENFESIDLKNALCDIFGFSADEDILEALHKIERGYQYVPVMQEILERVFLIITDNQFLPAMCNSKNQMIEILENWAGNLVDYQHLVKTLFEIMGITESALKNRTYLVESIKKMVFNVTSEKAESQSIRFRDDRNPSEEIFEEIKKLKKENNTVEFFCEDAKSKLNLPVSYSNEALYSKILKILEDSDVAKKYVNEFDNSTFN